MRLFIAVLLPEDVRMAITRRRNKMEACSHVRWIPPESLHATLKFLGEVDSSRLEDIRVSLARVAASHPRFKLGVGSGGFFPDKKSPRVFWTGLNGDVDVLKKMADHVENSLSEIGFEKEKRGFEPHITVARVGEPYATRDPSFSMRAGDQFCTLFAQFQSALFEVEELHLMESRLGPKGANYASLHCFPLGAA